MNKKFSILDYGSNNLKSVSQSIKNLDYDCVITSDEKVILNSNCLIIPGVGSFKNAMNNIINSNIHNAIYKFHKSGRIIVGICLGMQLFFDISNEFGYTNGLSLIKGKVLSLNEINSKKNLTKIPNIGWNKIYINENDSPFAKFNDEYMYFVHSYYVESNQVNTLFYSKFSDTQFTSSIIHENILGFQFHPEKSGQIGQKLYQEICLYN